MPNIENVIRGLECCKWYNKDDCDECPYDYNGRGNEKTECTAELATDALALLSEQETTFEKDGHHIRCKSCGVYFCDMDREGDRYPQNFCPNCGKAVK